MELLSLAFQHNWSLIEQGKVLPLLWKIRSSGIGACVYPSCKILRSLNLLAKRVSNCLPKHREQTQPHPPHAVLGFQLPVARFLRGWSRPVVVTFPFPAFPLVCSG